MNRRRFLRGSAATVIGLPLLEYMLNDNGTALACGGSLPCRFLLFYCPTSLVPSGSDVENEGLTPTRTGFDYDVRPVFQPLEDLGLRGDISLVSKMFASPDNDLPGSYDSDYHGEGYVACITGVSTGGGNRGPSPEHVYANYVGSATRFGALVYQIDPVNGPEGGVSFAEQDGDVDTFEAQKSPSRAYETLFTGFMPGEMPPPGPTLEERLRVSSLSYAREQITALNARLGQADRQRLEMHLDHVRTLENRLAGSGMMMGTGACADPRIGADPPDIAANIPDQEARSQLFSDIIQMAFACDLSRSISISGTDALTESGMQHALWREHGGLHAEVQHFVGSQELLDDAVRWFIGQYGGILQRLKDIPEGAGTLLDNTAAVFAMEGGAGGRAADGGGDPNHSTDNMTWMLAGRAGGLRSGQHIVKQDSHPAMLLNTALRACGLEHDMGEISGSFDELFAP